MTQRRDPFGAKKLLAMTGSGRVSNCKNRGEHREMIRLTKEIIKE